MHLAIFSHQTLFGRVVHTFVPSNPIEDDKLRKVFGGRQNICVFSCKQLVAIESHSLPGTRGVTENMLLFVPCQLNYVAFVPWGKKYANL